MLHGTKRSCIWKFSCTVTGKKKKNIKHVPNHLGSSHSVCMHMSVSLSCVCVCVCFVIKELRWSAHFVFSFLFIYMKTQTSDVFLYAKRASWIMLVLFYLHMLKKKALSSRMTWIVLTTSTFEWGQADSRCTHASWAANFLFIIPINLTGILIPVALTWPWLWNWQFGVAWLHFTGTYLKTYSEV